MGVAVARTVRHFWPGFSAYLDALPDTRFQPFVTYKARFLIWWGLLLFLCKLGRIRSLDYELRDDGSAVLVNVNALAQTDQETLPVWKTLSHFLGHVGSKGLADFLTTLMRQLIRGKVLDPYRLLGTLVVAVDGTGHVSFRRRHCDHCLTQTHKDRTYYYHEVLEAKVVTHAGFALPMGTAFIDNQEADTDPSLGAERRKQDCELKAFRRLAEDLKAHYPQTRLCIAGDSLFACGEVIETCERNAWKYVLTFKPGRLPAVWEDFQQLLEASPESASRLELPDGTHLEFRWINGLSYTDSDHREHTFDAIQCGVPSWRRRERSNGPSPGSRTSP